MPDQLDVCADEQILLQRIGAGDNSAFEAFYKNYYPRLFRFILRMTRQPDNVEELIQETLLVVWEKPDGFNHESKISTWVFGIAYNKALKSIAKNARRSNDVDIDELADSIGDKNANPAKSREDQDWLGAALAILPAEQRAVIELTFYHGLSYQDVAKILDCPENTVKTRMFNARKKLQAFADTQEQ
jgi:RNA polymerase sigma-70 factor (ECF subfamily)